MPRYLISYDLKDSTPSPYRPILDAFEKEGLLYVVKGTYLHRLPNTTIWGIFPNAKAAGKAFDRAKAAAAKSIGRAIVVEKRFVAHLGGGTVLSDRRKAPEPQWTGKTDFETCRLHQVNDPFFS